MSDQSQGLKEDVAFLRSMAEQGRRGPLLGGIFLAAAGLVYGGASFLDWGVETGHLPFAVSDGQIWIGASLLFAAVWVLLFAQMRRSGHAAVGAAQFAFGAAWIASGLGIVIMLGALSIVSGRFHDPSMMNVNVLTTFAFYGAAWLVSGALARQRWMYLIAAAAFVLTLALALVSGTAAELLVFGAGLLLTLLVPGIKLMLQASR